LVGSLYAYWWMNHPRFGFFFKRGRSPFHLTRFHMYKRIQDTLSRVEVNGQVLSVSGRGPIVDMLRPRITQVVETRYPEVDIQALPYDDNVFGVVVSDQVLEHVTDPRQAVKESLRVVRPNGLIIHTTCFLNPIHLFPVDMWRFSPEALIQLAAGAELMEAGGWGNRSALLLMFMQVGHGVIPEHYDHPLHRTASYNDERFPIVTWIIARKPTATPTAPLQKTQSLVGESEFFPVGAIRLR